MTDKCGFLFQYSPKNSCIHRLHAGIKLSVLCFSSFTLYGASQRIFFVYAPILFIISIFARLSAVTVKKNCRFLFLYAVFIFLAKIIGMKLNAAVLKEVSIYTLLFMQKFALILFTASVFYETTSKLELFTLFEQIECFFCRKKHTGSFAAIFTLTLMCVPRVFEVWAQLNYGYDARADKRQGIVQACRRIFFLLPALVENLLRFAFTAEKALKNRTFLSG